MLATSFPVGTYLLRGMSQWLRDWKSTWSANLVYFASHVPRREDPENYVIKDKRIEQIRKLIHDSET